MSPMEAGAIEFEEPDWLEAFEDERQRFADKPRYLQEDAAYEAILTRWRRFHCTGAEVGQRRPAPVADAIIALAGLGVMAPRSLMRDLPRDGKLGYQSDDHCWLSIKGEQWRVTGIEDRMLRLEKMTFTAEDPETMQIDLARADWTKHTAAALAVLDAMRKK